MMNKILFHSLVLPAMLMVGCLRQAERQPSPMTSGLPVYSGESLRNIFYPLGGIGTGNLLIGGRGNILEFEIFNRAQMDELPPYMTFFSLWYSLSSNWQSFTNANKSSRASP